MIFQKQEEKKNKEIDYVGQKRERWQICLIIRNNTYSSSDN